MRGHMKIQAESGAMLSQTKEFRKPPEAGRDKEASTLETLEECSSAHTLNLDFWPPQGRENKFLLF